MHLPLMSWPSLTWPGTADGTTRASMPITSSLSNIGNNISDLKYYTLSNLIVTERECPSLFNSWLPT